MKTMYMHTRNGLPASYDSSFSPHINFAFGLIKVKLVPTLKQLREEQRKTKQEDDLHGYSKLIQPNKYGYVLVSCP